MRSMKAFSCFVLAVALFSCVDLSAQSSSVAPRISANVDDSSRMTLHGNVPRLARTEFDQGEAAPETQLTQVRLVLSRSTEQQAALDQYLADLQDASSPNYHKWLTPEQFGKLYGPADSDVAAIVAWLESHGLQVEPTPAGRTSIAFNGTVSQVAEAFHTSIHSFLTSDQQFTSNTTDPQIPAALAAVVQGVAHLNTIRPKAHSVRGNPGRINPETKRLEQSNTESSNGARPNLTTTSGGDFLYITPADAATIYNTPNFLNANFSGTACGSSTGCIGTGVKIGVGGVANIGTGSIAQTYRSAFLGNSYAVSPTIIATGTGLSVDSGNISEAYLDIELAGGLAPGASIYYYPSQDLYSGIVTAINANVVDIFSLSWGDCESDMGSFGNSQFNSIWQQAATQGIAVTVSTGDDGSAGCDDPNSVTVASLGMQVSGYASTPYNIAIGGTDTIGLNSSFTTYAFTSFGSSPYYRTAKNYIPESTWNDSNISNTTISANVPVTGKYAGIWAGSGGKSARYSKPTWQTGTGTFDTDGTRDIPDVSLMSGDGMDSAAWVACDSTDNCSSISGGNFAGFGGTSTAAPAFAGILALVQQSDTAKTGCSWVNCKRLGQAAQTLYSLHNGTNGNVIFHDTTLGNISVPCRSGTTNCSVNAAGYLFETGYDSATGYDLATGLGSVNVTNLITYWGTATGSAVATVAVTPSPNPATSIQAISVTVSVSGASGTPTGTITLSSGSYSSGAVTINTGTCTAASCVFTIPAGSLAIGTDTLTAAYSGDTNYAAKTNNSNTVTVTGLVPTVGVSAAATLNSNVALTVTVTTSATGGGGTPTGTVTLSSGSYSSGAVTIGSGTCTTAANCVFTIPANTFTASGNATLTAVYSGNTTYISASGTTTVAVTYVPVPTFSLAASAATAIATPGGSTTSTITVTAANGYTGSVMLSCALTNSPSGASYLPSCSIPSTAVSMGGTATATVTSTAATAALDYPKLPGRGRGLFGAGGGAVLALLVFFGIPARRRSWRSMLGILVIMAALGTLSACGGKTPTGSTGTAGTTLGTYTFTVTGTGTPAVSVLPTTTFTVTVN